MGGGGGLVPLMSLPVKVCRAASATVIRGPASVRGRESRLHFLFQFGSKDLTFRFREIVKAPRSHHGLAVWGKGRQFHGSRMTSLMETDNFHQQESRFQPDVHPEWATPQHRQRCDKGLALIFPSDSNWSKQCSPNSANLYFAQSWS